MATNPYLANLLERIGPMLARMPQLPTQFAGQRPPMQGLFGSPGTLAPMQQRQMPMMPAFAPFQPRRRAIGTGGQMPRLDLTQLTQALQNAPGFGARIPSAAPSAAPMTAPAAPLGTRDTNGTLVGGNPFIGYQGGPMTAPQIAANSGWTPELGNLFAHNA